MKVEDVKKLSLEQIEKTIFEKKRELLNLRFQLKMGSLKNVSQIKRTKQVVARLFTVLNAQKLQNVGK